MKNQSLLLKTLRGERGERPPIWFMRQAGRYLPEYRKVREGRSFLEMVQTPELAAEVTLQPLRRFKFDGAIIFADILTPLIGMGADLSFHEGEGPRINNPIRQRGDIEALRIPDPRETSSYTLEALKLVKNNLDSSEIGLLGFAGAPFTLSAYLIEGESPGDLKRTKALMLTEPELWHALQSKLVDATAQYLIAQVEAGAEALQVFDSWLGQIGPLHYTKYIEPYLMKLFQMLREKVDVPLIFFATSTTGLVTDVSRLPIDCLGVDWRVRLSSVSAATESRFTLQGNIDPQSLFGTWDNIKAEAHEILQEGSQSKAHIFNLGHGILPTTPIDNVGRLVDFVREYRHEK